MILLFKNYQTGTKKFWNFQLKQWACFIMILNNQWERGRKADLVFQTYPPIQYLAIIQILLFF